MAASKVARARDDAMAAERIRQQGYDRETDALNVQSQDRYQNFEGQQEQKAKQLGDYFAAQAPTPDEANAAAALPTSASNITLAEEQKQRANARSFTDKQATSLGDLRAFGDRFGDISRMQARDASLIGQIGGFKRGSASILPLELEKANSAGAKAGFLGDLFGGAGNLAISSSLNGGGGDTIANSLELKLGADPWRGLRSTGDKSFAKQFTLGRVYGS